MKRLLLVVLALTGLLATLPAAVPGSIATATAASSSWGTSSAPDQSIRQGCQAYRYGYRISAPGDAWMAEIQLLSPRGRRLANVTVQSTAQRSTAQRTWRLCDENLRPGDYRIRMKITSYDGRETTEQFATPSTFSLSR